MTESRTSQTCTATKGTPFSRCLAWLKAQFVADAQASRDYDEREQRARLRQGRMP